MSPTVAGLVESSINCAICCLEEGKHEGNLVIDFLARSSNNLQFPYISECLAATARTAGARYSGELSSYPGLASPLWQGATGGERVEVVGKEDASNARAC